MWENENEYADLDSFGSSWAPERAFVPDFSSLPTGDYDCRIVEAQLTQDAKNNRIFQCTLEMNGNIVNKTWWLNEQKQVNAFCADLIALGLDADKWGPKHNRPLSVEIPKAATALKGVRFRGKITSRTYQGKTFFNLNIGGRIMGSTMPSITQTSTPPPQTNSTKKPDPSSSGDEISDPSSSGDEIPF